MYTYIYTRPHKLLSFNSYRVKIKATYLLTYLSGALVGFLTQLEALQILDDRDS